MTDRLCVTPAPALPRGLVRPPFDRSLYVWRRRGETLLLWLRGPRGIVQVACDRASLIAWAEGESPDLAIHVASLLDQARPRRFAGFALTRPLVMGVLNVTPNSFSDGGLYQDRDQAIAHGRAMAAAGADIIDIGGESTRPGAEPVPPSAEIDRILPVVRALAAEGLTLSVDTRHAPVMRAAIDAGARIINDVTALGGDPDSLGVAAASGAAVILMHMQGEPQTMQQNPSYEFTPIDVYDQLAQRVAACLAAGIARDRLCLDPGIGFGKTVADNLAILAHLELYRGLGLPLLLGVSRKSFVAALSRREAVDLRLPGSLAAALAGLQQGVDILRVHDVAETAQAVAVWRAIEAARTGPASEV